GLNFRTKVLKWNVFDVLAPRSHKAYCAMKKSVSICVICGKRRRRSRSALAQWISSNLRQISITEQMHFDGDYV
ncbi:MAG: hypothetical protein RSB34_08630, partial [Muribaculaceae bacterium]